MSEINKITHNVLTIDIDWAADKFIEMVAEYLVSANVKATFFATHRFDLLDQLRDNPLFEFGIHPNFLPGSSQGETHSQVLNFCMDLVPQCCTIRTHCLYQSGKLWDEIADHCPQLTCDSSIFLPAVPVAPVVHRAGSDHRALVRVPFNFADDAFSRRPGWTWRAPPPAQRHFVNVMCFHPTMLALNGDRLDCYDALKKSLGSRPLNEATEEDIRAHRHEGNGAWTYLREYVETAAPDSWATLSEIAMTAQDRMAQ